jgi:hypothetical protein
VADDHPGSGAALPPERRFGLTWLENLGRQSLDPGYAAAAGRRRQPHARPTPRSVTIAWLAVAMMVAGVTLAGAEAIQVGDVRIGVDSAFTGDNSQLMLDGRPLNPPFGIRAIGDGPTLSAALAIPGGVMDSVTRTGAGIHIGQSRAVVIDALRAQRTPQYARPAG